MSKITFALPYGYDWDVNTFVKQVKTKAFVKKHKNDLSKYAYKLTSANIDNRQLIGSMLQTAFGVNIGRQIEDKLTDNDLSNIKSNIISIVYN